MKKLLPIIFTMTTLLSITGCSTDNEISNNNQTNETKITNTTNTANNHKALIVYFSYGENANLPENVDTLASASIQKWNNETTGNTGILAHLIQAKTNADIFSIKTVEKYPANYDETVTIAQEEHNANSRPELSNHIENINNYDTIFIGYPNWWYDMPMAMYSFFAEYDLSNKTIIPFNTSGGSQFSDTIQTIQELEPNATVLEGLSVHANNMESAEDEVNSWLKSLNYID